MNQTWTKRTGPSGSEKAPTSNLPGSVITLTAWLALSATLPMPAWSAEPLDARLRAEPREALVAAARREGDAQRGAAVFYSRALACASCHSVGDRPEAIGPDLATLDQKTSDAQLVESVLEPSRTIADRYATVTVETVDGRLLTGLPVEESTDLLVLRDAATPEKLITLKAADIASRQRATRSIMPDGQVNQMADRGQFVDLVRYLIELRDGGPQRARQLQPPADPRAQKIPDDPLPWRPVVQRGEVAVEPHLKYPRAVALGFVGGTVLFDADQLRTAAVWYDGFVRHSPQNYFGLFWHRDGGPAELPAEGVQPLSFRFSGATGWQSCESPVDSDPNTGSRFAGYQVGKSAVRLRYFLRIGDRRIEVTEDVRLESRPAWRGVAREYRLVGLPAGSEVALALPETSAPRFFDAQGRETAGPEIAGPMVDSGRQPLFGGHSSGTLRIVRTDPATGARWRAADQANTSNWQLHSRPAVDGQPLVLRVDTWTWRAASDEPTAEQLGSLVSAAPLIDDAFASAPPTAVPATSLPPAPQPEAATEPSVARPGVQPRENIDEFPPVRTRFLRFVVTRTNDNTEPGLDELEVYGKDPEVNLALAGKATASSVISGYPIHQIPHLNDGKLGNSHSWISAERGGGWAQIEFAEPVEVRKIVWARDRTGVCRDRLAVAYRIEVSADGANWTQVGDQSGRAVGDSVPIRRDARPGYVLEAIPGPFPTWRPSDIVFTSDGTLYAIAMTEGQVWRTRLPPRDQPQRVVWQRFATGLYHPIGLAVVDDRLYVAQKPEITELIDGDGDGIADQYRTLATGWGLSTGWHEYCFGLAVDPDKNLWFALNTGNFWTHAGFVNPGRWRGSILRVDHGTEHLEAVASGCRVPNGIALGPEGQLFFTDNQGDWIQSCKLAHVVAGRFYGHPETKEDALPKDTYPDGRSAVWLPYEQSRSTSGPVHDATGGRFGPFADQMFVGDVGYGANAGIMRIALEKVDGEYQGAAIRFVAGQPLGCERMKFGPDNQLYMASLTSGLTRMAYRGVADGQAPMAIHSLRVRPGGTGFDVQLTRPLAENVKLAADQFRVKRFHYHYSGNYGSPRADEQDVPVRDVRISSDRKTVQLSLPLETHPLGMVYHLQLAGLTADDGQSPSQQEAWYTLHRIPR